MSKILYVAMTLLLLSCGGSGGSSSGSGGSDSATFNGSGSITIDDIATSDSKATSVGYYGRFIYWDGSDIFGGSIHFTVNKNNSSSAYFSDFYLDHYSKVTGFSSSTNIVTSSTNLNISAGFGAASNSIEVNNSSSRFIDLNMDFGNNTYFPDVANAGVIFSNDFTTMVGGDNSSFYFIAQKASSQPNASTSNIKHSWSTINFSVSGAGNISISSTSKVTPSGIGGNGFTAFKGSNSSNGYFDGEVSLADNTSALFLFGYGSGSGTPTAIQADGLFLLSSDKRFILGVDVSAGEYFAGWK